MKRIICFEGLPGSGKTTLSRALASNIGGVPVPEFIDGESGEINFFDVCHNFYEPSLEILSKYHKKAKYVQRLRAEHVVSVDRGFLSCAAYIHSIEKSYGGSERSRLFRAMLRSYISDSICVDLFVYCRVTVPGSLEEKPPRGSQLSYKQYNLHLYNVSMFYERFFRYLSCLYPHKVVFCERNIGGVEEVIDLIKEKI